MSQEREDIIRRMLLIRDRMKRPGSEAEMLAASETLAAMAAKYNLELHELDEREGKTDATFEPLKHPGKYNETWRKTCYDIAASMYMCHLYFKSQPGNKAAAILYTIVGEPHNVAVAVEMGKYFEEAINRLANDAARVDPEVLIDHTHRHRFIRSFRLAASERLEQRVRDYIRRAKAGQVKTETGESLPALRDLYQQSDDMYEQWKAAVGLKVRETTPRDQGLSSRGRQLGRAAGDQIALSTQLRSNSASSKFALPKQ